jgi:hypothetical protein
MVSSVVAANTGAAFLASVPTSGSWLQDAASADASSGADWMDPNSSGPDVVDQAANAFASAHLAASSQQSSLSVNQGISSLETALSGQTVDLLA